MILKRMAKRTGNEGKRGVREMQKQFTPPLDLLPSGVLRLTDHRRRENKNKDEKALKGGRGKALVLSWRGKKFFF